MALIRLTLKSTDTGSQRRRAVWLQTVLASDFRFNQSPIKDFEFRSVIGQDQVWGACSETFSVNHAMLSSNRKETWQARKTDFTEHYCWYSTWRLFSPFSEKLDF